MQEYRGHGGGTGIDRERRVTFTFDGRALEGFEGDTLASALLANGVRLVGRSFKYHRPRGVFGAGVEEPNALVRVRGGDRAEPNLRATEVALFDGLRAESQNRWPSLDFDVGQAVDLASRLLPSGFYYKTFMWPGGWWLFYERFIRRAAGLGRPPLVPDPDHYAKRFAHCDVLVVGAGPAGLAAARAAASAGADVIVADDGAHPGGSLLHEDLRVGGAPGADWAGGVAADLRASPRVRVLARTSVFGYYDQNLLWACERVADHLPAPARHQPRQRTWMIRAAQVVLATGAVERPLVFANNDRPGVMLASAVRAYANRYAVRCGDRAVLLTNNDDAYRTVPALVGQGAGVAAVVDLRAAGPGAGAAGLAGRAGVPVLAGQAVVAARGARRLAGVDVMRLGDGGASVGGDVARIDCDLLCMSGGWTPNVHLFSQSQGATRFAADVGAFVPDRARQAQSSAGAARGTFTLAGCIAEGAEAGAAAAAACGHRGGRRPGNPECDEVEAALPGPPAAIPLPAGVRGKRFVDFQNDVTVDDIRLAAREGYQSVEHLKRYTTLGMGTDQGRTSNVAGLSILAGERGEPIPDVGHTTFRPPFAPVTLGAIAAREVGREFAPVRRTPMHDWHARAGAPFVTAGPWLRPQYYPRPGESAREAIAREARTVRVGVGLVDVSTLGKIEIRGRDAGEFLERVYINRWRNLAVGRVRYGFMLREDGFILDDGTTTRVAQNEYYMTTTTGNAGPVMSHLEFYAQTVWPDLHVHLTSVSDQWAGMALAGPRARDVLAAACDGADVGDGALPFMGYLEATIDGAPVRIFRMTFSGELAFEVHTPAGYGLHAWCALLAAGEPFRIVPYGTEAMGVLRIEKGHVVAAELDGTTVPADFGFDAMYRRKAGDFIGRRSLERPGLVERRPRLVGLVSEDGRRIPRGAQLVTNPTKPRPVEMLGHVTATCYSPNLEQEIGLALLADGGEYAEARLYAASPLAGQSVPVRVTAPVFIDPDGYRPRG